MTDVPAGAPPPTRRQRHLHLDDEVWEYFDRIGRGNASDGAYRASRIARTLGEKMRVLPTALSPMANQLEHRGDIENAATLRNFIRQISEWIRDAEAWY